MANVTFKVSDLTGGPLPANTTPEVVFIPSEPAITIDGIAISTYPVTYRPDASGQVTANLYPTDGVEDRNFHYQLQIRWLVPGGYGDDGYASVDFPKWKIRVPPEGGSLVDLIDLPYSPFKVEAMWVGPTPPPAGFVHWFDTSGTNIVYKEWVA